MSTLEFDELLLSHAYSLKPFAIRLTKDNEVANDLFQETLYKALSNREKYNVGTNIKAWLYTIMRNIFINDYRRNAKSKTIFDYTINDFLFDSSPVIISNTAENTIQLKEIKQSIHTLPEIFKTPFLLYFDGYRYHEISEALNEPLGTIKSRIHFARKLLKEQLNRF
jgi:RNA polymerase sigma-70 factor (ECF subfamily)